jgi:hypothetical protein
VPVARAVPIIGYLPLYTQDIAVPLTQCQQKNAIYGIAALRAKWRVLQDFFSVFVVRSQITTTLPLAGAELKNAAPIRGGTCEQIAARRRSPNHP